MTTCWPLAACSQTAANVTSCFTSPISTLAPSTSTAIASSLSDDQLCSVGLDSWPRCCGVYVDRILLFKSHSSCGQDSRALAEGPNLLLETSTITGKQGEYQITAPAAWSTSQKAGADILVVSPEAKSTSVGVTAVPVRVQTLEQFGSVNEVATKLLEAEKKKESTMSVDVLMSSSLKLESGDTAYSFEYDLNSTRGRKRILNLVTISKARLFIVNGQCKCVEEGCPEASVAQLRSIVSSFKLR